MEAAMNRNVTVVTTLALAVTILASCFISCSGGGGGGGTPPPQVSGNANLASLIASHGLMNPSFDSTTTVYTSMFIGQPSITVTATAADAGSTIKVNGQGVVSGHSSQNISLNPGQNSVTVVVTAADGVTTKTYTITANLLSQEAYAKASNTDVPDEFGWSVSLSGDTLAVAAPLEASNATGINGDQANNSAYQSGAVYVFIRTGSTWTQQAYIKASNSGGLDWFGYSVSLLGDTLAVGSPWEASSNGNQGDNGASGSGAVYVFARNGTTWTQQAYIKASTIGPNDNFGYSVSLSGDTLAVGAPEESSSAKGINGDQADNNANVSGAVYVLIRTGTTWTQQAYIKASNTDASDWFGSSVSLSGNTLAVGAPWEASNAQGINGDQADNGANQSGAVYVFTRTGTTWSQQEYIKASNSIGGTYFGRCLSLSGDTLAVAAPYEASSATGINGDQANTNASGSGAAYVFSRNGTTWTQQAYIKASNTESNDNFGWSVSLSGDILAVGAPAEASVAKGIGSNQADNSGVGSGAAYLFTRTGTTWTQQSYIKASNTDARDNFGFSVAISGDTTVAGANNEGSNATGINGNQADNSAFISGTGMGSGAVYILR
jgi:trimeric autotransporter adhesin